MLVNLMSEQVENRQFRPGPQVTSAEGFFVFVSDRVMKCEAEHDQFEPPDERRKEWYKFAYDVLGLHYGPPLPHHNQLSSIEIIPVLPYEREATPYIGLVVEFDDDRYDAVMDDADDSNRAQVYALLQIDTHDFNRDHFSYRVLEGGPDQSDEPRWLPLSPNLSYNIAGMMYDEYQHIFAHDRRPHV
jgi:hypothetical protein